MRTISAAAIYFALVFAAGFALGAARLFLLAPRIGALAAVAVELLPMLVLSWLACGAALRRAFPRDGAGPDLARRGAIGALAFFFLMASEAALALTLGGESAAAYLGRLARPESLLGLAGQAVFALMPLIRLRDAWRRPVSH